MPSATKPKKKLPSKVPFTAKLKPKVKRELERLATHHGERPAPYAANIIEAHTKGMAWCSACNMAHPIKHNEDNRR